MANIVSIMISAEVMRWHKQEFIESLGVES